MSQISDVCENRDVNRYLFETCTRLLPAAALATVAAVTTVLFHPAIAKAEMLDDAKENGVTIAVANEPPYMQINPDGTPGGWGPEMDAAVLKEAGVAKFSGQLMEYGAMIPALQSNRADLASSGALYIKPERCEAVLFSDPVSCSGESLIMAAALREKVKTYDDVAKQGLKIGVCGGCTEQKLALEAGVKEDSVVVFPDGASGLKLLEDGRIDVFANDSATTANLFKRLDPADWHYVRIENIRSCGGAAFNKNSAELRDAYNDGLRRIRANGTYMKIMKKYGLQEDARDIEKTSTQQLCEK
ncbi:ectoine/hydroxyectoine ABC transporter substrate-binding protein EhuB [Sinorhizobium meliloti]|uniref:ectoine/hydroxyectoine ABC transporter substrate-binding protein EhuB n=1 Tax=Rhizobium meliloti TaxID=382 RepID=UPI000FD8897D|nr:ectoine/hydroxyectoine ABC transporter substrate-binding protein EhuB [Sinorhizobium meliloti]RVI61358.1 ectoine/hydroxyectoine ABC transporter substrate-binding protein EhuB [Sinorhizobium meliloti]